MGRLHTTLNWLWRELRIGVPVATGCGLFFGALFREQLSISLIYSLCVGFTIQCLIETGRYGFSYLLRKRLRDAPGLERNWPGWWLMAPWVFVAGSIGYFAGHTLGDWFTGLHRTPDIVHNPRSLFVIMAFVFSIAMACVYFLYARGRMASMEARAQAAMRAAAENQLKMLESQLEPHMLFNTLANLRVLIGLDPPKAQLMLDRIISFLRATLDASRAGSHPLSAEFARIGDYLEMMQVRMGSRLHFHLDLPADLAGLPVPPLLLQPLVENAIKHGLEPKVAGGRIEVAAQRQGDTLTLTVRDTGVGMGAQATNGTRFGMQQVRERLRTLFGELARLELAPAGGNEGGMAAIIRLPIAREPVHS